MRRHKLAISIFLVAALAATVIPVTADAQWLPEECDELEWYSPPSAIWSCLTAVAGMMFGGNPMWEGDGNPFQ